MKELVKKIILFFFVGVPVLFSIISTIHIVDLFVLGDSKLLAYVSAVGIELGAIGAFLGLSVMKKLNKWIVWTMFIALFFLQIIGNVYSAYAWVSIKVLADPNWLTYFQDMLNFVASFKDPRDVKMILALIVGVPSPLFSVFLLKSTMDYLEPDEITKESDEPSLSIEIDNKGEEIEGVEHRSKRLHPSHQV